jgi:hypothetical protein
VQTRSGLAFPAAAWDEHVIEEQVPHSTALHAHLAGGGRYLTGPLARYSLNSRWLSPLAREAARAAGLGPACDKPFRSIIVRAVEMVYALEEALRVVAVYEPPGRPAADLLPERDGVVLNSWADDVIPHGHENREEVAEPLDVDKPGMGTLVTVSITAIRSGRAMPFRCSPSPDPGRRRHGHWPADLRDLGPCSGWLSPLCGLG